jgi:hypothetical protein
MRTAAATAFLLAACCLAPARQAAEEPPWHADYAKALAEARRTGKPLLVLFH